MGGDEFGFQDGMVVEGLPIVGTCKTMGTVTVAEANRTRPVNGDDEVNSK